MNEPLFEIEAWRLANILEGLYHRYPGASFQVRSSVIAPDRLLVYEWMTDRWQHVGFIKEGIYTER